MSVTLFRDAALADGTGPALRLGVSVLVDADRIRWIGATGDEPDPGPAAEVVDASGCTIVRGVTGARGFSVRYAARTSSEAKASRSFPDARAWADST